MNYGIRCHLGTQRKRALVFHLGDCYSWSYFCSLYGILKHLIGHMKPVEAIKKSPAIAVHLLS